MSGKNNVTDANEVKVTVPITYLFDQVNNRLDEHNLILGRIDSRLGDTATKDDIKRIDIHLAKHDGEIAELQTKQTADEAKEETRGSGRKVLAWVIASVLVPLGAAGIYLMAAH